MPRAPRIQPAGVFIHVTYRTVEGQPLFRDRQDRWFHDDLQARVARECEWQTFMACQMKNHGHWLLRMMAENLGRGMQLFLGQLVQRFNRRYCREGHLVERRFRSTIVETEMHFLEALRYIALNPVAAGACRRPEEWEWSSYRSIIGHAPAPAHLAVDEILPRFGRDAERARHAFASFVCDRLPPSLQERPQFRPSAPHRPERPWPGV